MRQKIVKILSFFLILSALTMPTMRQQMILAYNTHNLFRSAAAGEHMPNQENYFLISRENHTQENLRIF